MTITEKVAYLKGLAEGLALDPESSKEAKLIASMIDILEDIGLSVADLEENTQALGDELDELSDDLAEVEEVVYDDEDDEDDDEDDEDFFEVDCPNCGETLEIDEDVLDEGTIVCPSCHQKFALDLGGGCSCGEECDCGCHDGNDGDEE